MNEYSFNRTTYRRGCQRQKRPGSDSSVPGLDRVAIWGGRSLCEELDVERQRISVGVIDAKAFLTTALER